MLNPRNKLASRREWLAQLRLRKAFESAMSSQLAKEFSRMGKAAKNAYALHGSVPRSLTLEHAGKLMTILRGSYVAVATTFAKRMLHAIPAAKMVTVPPTETKDTEDEISAKIQAFAKKLAAKRVVDISKTTERRINREIERGVEDGLTPTEVADNIEEATSGSIGRFRAEVIARTETHTAGQAGSLEAARSLPIEVKKQWVAVSDERTRDDHSEVDGEQIDLDDTFTVGDDEMSFPGDPNGSAGEVINCRCVMVYVSKEK